MAQRRDHQRSNPPAGPSGPSAIAISGDPQASVALAGQVAQVGAIANTHAAANAFANYRSRKVFQTIRRHDAALGAFAHYLAIVHIPADAHTLATEPAAWQGMTWGLTAGFAGLRAGELAGLQVDDLDLGAGELRFHRPKVNKTQTHRPTRDALAAARAYLAYAPPQAAARARWAHYSVPLADGALSAVGISERVRVWLSGDRLKLGWCWEGNPHTWLGSSSCAARIGLS